MARVSRRMVVLGGIGVVATAKRRAYAEREPGNLTDTYSEVANAADIARKWPDGRNVPQLIVDVADYLRDKPWRSLGTTRLLGDRMDDYWIENGADLWRDFGCFMRLPDGSRVAQWFREGETGEPPVVLIGSEGEQVVLAEDLNSFLAAWALAGFDDQGALVAKSKIGSIAVALPSDLIRGEDDDDDDIPDGRPAFATFLEMRLGQPLAGFLKPKPEDAPFKAFFDAWGETARADMATNPNLSGIANILDTSIPRGKEIWERVSFHIAAVGDRIEIGSKGDPRKRLGEADAAAIRPLIRAERERRATGRHAPRGLWHSASVLLYPDGACQIAADWSSAPKFWDGAHASGAELASDQARFPKSPRWLEPWMTDLQ